MYAAQACSRDTLGRGVEALAFCETALVCDAVGSITSCCRVCITSASRLRRFASMARCFAFFALLREFNGASAPHACVPSGVVASSKGRADNGGKAWVVCADAVTKGAGIAAAIGVVLNDVAGAGLSNMLPAIWGGVGSSGSDGSNAGLPSSIIDAGVAEGSDDRKCGAAISSSAWPQNVLRAAKRGDDSDSDSPASSRTSWRDASVWVGGAPKLHEDVVASSEGHISGSASMEDRMGCNDAAGQI